MPHCHRGGGGVRWNILSEEKLDCVGALAALHSRLEHEEKGKKKKKKRGILSLYIPPEQPGVHSVSKKEKIGFVILIFLLLFVRWGRDTCSSCTCCLHWTPFVLQMEPKGKPTNMLPPTTTTSFPLPLPRFLLSEQRNTDEGRGCHEL